MTPADLIKPLVWFEVEKSRLGGKYNSDGYTIWYIEGFWLMDFAGEGKLSWRFPSLDCGLGRSPSRLHHPHPVSPRPRRHRQDQGGCAAGGG